MKHHPLVKQAIKNAITLIRYALESRQYALARVWRIRLRIWLKLRFANSAQIIEALRGNNAEWGT